MTFSIGQLLDRIEKGERMNEIVSEFGLLKKHFSEQLKENGYRGDRAGRYHWDHADTPEPLEFNLLDKYAERVEKHLREQNESFEEVTENKDNKGDNGDKLEKIIPAASASKAIASPLIQFVEEKKQEQPKIYRGYYLEPHVAAVMDKIQNKSEVANIALEKFFKEQGLL